MLLAVGQRSATAFPPPLWGRESCGPHLRNSRKESSRGWRLVALRCLLHQCERMAVGVGEERHPQIVIVHLGDQMRLAVKCHAALLELAHRERNVGAAEVDDRALRDVL